MKHLRIALFLLLLLTATTAAATRVVLLGLGPDVRPALAQAAADHPDLHVAELPPAASPR